jgi:hypothetical protein
MSDNIWYSVGGESFTTDCEDEIKRECIDYALSWDHSFKAGDQLTYSKGVRYDPKPSDFCKDIAWDILNQIEASADDEMGEWSDGITICSDEARQELNQLVASWADQHLSVDCFTVKQVEDVEFVVTQEMIDEVCA